MIVPSVISNAITYSKFKQVDKRLDKLEQRQETQPRQSDYVPSIFREKEYEVVSK